MTKVQRLSIGNALDVKDSVGLPIGSITRFGDLVYTYGMISIDPDSGEIVGGDVKTQTHRVLDNLKIVLEKAGTSFDKVIMVTIFLANITKDFRAFNEAYSEYFGDNPPTRYCVGAPLAFPEVNVEIQMIAAA